MHNEYGSSIKSFYEIDSYGLKQQLSEKIKEEIQGKSKDYILGVDEEEFKKYLIDKYSLEPLFVDIDNGVVEAPTISKEWVEESRMSSNGRYQTDVYRFTIKFKFTGSSILFRVRPDSFILTSADIYVNDHQQTVSYDFKLNRRDPDEFERLKDDFQRRAFGNLYNTNIVANDWNYALPGIVNAAFQNQKSIYQSENDFFVAINIKVNKDTESVFTAPTIKKKDIPQPSISKKMEFSSEPMMGKVMYDDILKVIYDSGKNMERKPALYINKDEEGLRDQFLFVLETRYEGTTATGETFNRSGKTDIILKYAKDASNLFVAECKFWHGGGEFLKAISQLFDRYLTWRDSKAALILFVTNKDFSNVLQTIETEIRTHPYFIKEEGKRGETSYSYIFHLPQDINKRVYFEVLSFHYDKE